MALTRPIEHGAAYLVDNKPGAVAVDQLRTVDRERLVQRVGALPEATLAAVLARLTEFFAVSAAERVGRRSR